MKEAREWVSELGQGTSSHMNDGVELNFVGTETSDVAAYILVVHLRLLSHLKGGAEVALLTTLTKMIL